MATPNYEQLCCPPQVRCTVARDIAAMLSEKACNLEIEAKKDCGCCNENSREMKLEAKVLRSVARIITQANVKR